METRRSKWKTRCLRLALALGAALLAVVAVELGYRVYMFGWGALSPTEMRSLHRLGRSGLLKRSQLPGLRYEHKPNLETRYHMQPFVTNSRGMRDREYQLAKPADTFRVAVIGDSWTMGSGVAIEDVYHSVIESRLAERGGPLAYEFLNFGVAGYELWDYVGVVEHGVRQFNPDLILVALSGTDHVIRAPGKPHFVVRPEINHFWVLTLLEDFRLQRENSARKKEKGKAFRAERDQLARERTASRARDDEPRAAKRRASRRSPAQRPEPMPKATMVYLRETLSELAQACERAETPLVVCFLSMSFNPQSTVTRAFAKVCGENEIPYRDMGSAFKGYRARQFWVFRDDHHPNAAGHALFADEVLAYLEEGGFLER